MKRWIILPLVLVMLFSVFGCSAPAEEVQSGAEPEQGATGSTDNDGSRTEPARLGEADSTGEDIKGFYELNSPFDLASHFREVVYTYGVAGAEGGTGRYAFSVLDEKVIEGTKAYQISFERSGDGVETIIECWVNDQEVLEGSIDGKTREGHELIILNGMLNSLMLPFSFTIMMEEVVTKPQMQAMLGWSIVDDGAKTVDLGEGSIPVHYYELETNSGETAYIEVASVGGRNIIVHYQNSKEEKTYELNTTRLIAR